MGKCLQLFGERTGRVLHGDDDADEGSVIRTHGGSSISLTDGSIWTDDKTPD